MANHTVTHLPAGLADREEHLRKFATKIADQPFAAAMIVLSQMEADEVKPFVDHFARVFSKVAISQNATSIPPDVHAASARVVKETITARVEIMIRAREGLN